MQPTVAMKLYHTSGPEADGPPSGVGTPNTYLPDSLGKVTPPQRAHFLSGKQSFLDLTRPQQGRGPVTCSGLQVCCCSNPAAAVESKALSFFRQPWRGGGQKGPHRSLIALPPGESGGRTMRAGWPGGFTRYFQCLVGSPFFPDKTMGGTGESPTMSRAII